MRQRCHRLPTRPPRALLWRARTARANPKFAAGRFLRRAVARLVGMLVVLVWSKSAGAMAASSSLPRTCQTHSSGRLCRLPGSRDAARAAAWLPFLCHDAADGRRAFGRWEWLPGTCTNACKDSAAGSANGLLLQSRRRVFSNKNAIAESINMGAGRKASSCKRAPLPSSLARARSPGCSCGPASNSTRLAISSTDQLRSPVVVRIVIVVSEVAATSMPRSAQWFFVSTRSRPKSSAGCQLKKQAMLQR